MGFEVIGVSDYHRSRKGSYRMSDGKLRVLSFKGMREHVAEVLREAVLDGTFKPGDPLGDAKIAAQLNISRGPVREALLQLENESLVRNVHNKGWFVIRLTPEEVSEITHLRTLLEPSALSLAAKNITAADLDRLAEIFLDFCRAIEAQNWRNAHKKDFEFHQFIWHFSRNRLLEETLIRISAPYFAYLHTLLGILVLRKQDWEGTIRMHALLVDYLAGRTSLTAEECITAHLECINPSGWHLLEESTPAQAVSSKQ